MPHGSNTQIVGARTQMGRVLAFSLTAGSYVNFRIREKRGESMSFQRKVFIRKNDRPGSMAKADNQQGENTSRKPTEDQGARAIRGMGTNQYQFDNQDRIDQRKDIDAQRHPEEQNVDPSVYTQNDRKNLNGSPQDQKI